MVARRTAAALAALLVAVALLLLWGAPAPAAAQAESVHLAMGNPSGAAPDPALPGNYLIVRPQYALGYIRDDGIARWVSWRLVAADMGLEDRASGFRQDTTLPADWYRVRDEDYTNSGYNRGHMVPSEDRTATVDDNRATFLLTNAVPQSPDNNGGPWVDMENLGRDLASLGDEVYTVAGPDGELGRLALGRLRIPARTWRALLAVRAGEGDPVARVTTATRLTAISVPNDKGDAVTRSDDWELYATTVDAIESATGLDLYAALPPTVQRVIESRVDPGARPYTLTISGTASLTATVGAAYPPLAVQVRGPGGEPVAGVEVTFAALGGDASADLGGDVVVTVTTGADGVALVRAVAGPGGGSSSVEASVAGVYTPAAFTLATSAPQEAPAVVVLLPLVVR